MLNWNKVIYVLCIGILIEGLRNLIFVTETPMLLTLVLVCLPLVLMYLIHTMTITKSNKIFSNQINSKRVSLGVLLILLVVAYNLFTHGAIGEIDCGLLFAGSFIILLNLLPVWRLKLDEEMVSFSTYFIFSFAIIYLAIFLLPLRIVGSNVNPLFVPVTKIVTGISVFLLNFIKPTTVVKEVIGSDGLVHSVIINFSGFELGIGDPCSGVVSIAVFLTVIIAYFVSVEKKNTKKMFLYTFIGVCALFCINFLRIIVITLTGYYLGADAMLFVHVNLGWVFFAIVMVVFWYFTVYKV